MQKYDPGTVNWQLRRIGQIASMLGRSFLVVVTRSLIVVPECGHSIRSDRKGFPGPDYLAQRDR